MPGHRHHADAAGGADVLADRHGPAARTMIGSKPTAARADRRRPPWRPRPACPWRRTWSPDGGRRANACSARGAAEVLSSARESGAAPLTAGLALVPGGGTTHWPGRRHRAQRRPPPSPCRPGAPTRTPAGTTVRPTTTPGPSGGVDGGGVGLAVGGSASARSWPGPRSCPGSDRVGERGQRPGRQAQVARHRLGRRPGLKTSISEEPPGTSWAWGMAQCGLGRARPRHQREAARGPARPTALHLGRHDAPGPGGDDGADGRRRSAPRTPRSPPAPGPAAARSPGS